MGQFKAQTKTSRCAQYGHDHCYKLQIGSLDREKDEEFKLDTLTAKYLANHVLRLLQQRASDSLLSQHGYYNRASEFHARESTSGFKYIQSWLEESSKLFLARPRAAATTTSSRFQNRGPSQPLPYNAPQENLPLQAKSNLEYLISKYITSVDAKMQSVEPSQRNQIGHLANMISDRPLGAACLVTQKRTQGSTPRQVTLRSGKEFIVPTPIVVKK